MKRARAREKARALANEARQIALSLRDSDTAVGVMRAITALANAVDELADVSEDQDAE